MIRRLTALAAVCAAASVAAGAGTASSRPPVINLLEIGDTEVALDGGTEFDTPKAGDRFYFASALYTWAGTKKGKRIGRDEGLCTYTLVRFPKVLAYCTAEFHLPAGDILIASFIRFSEGPLDITVPITGGTKAYANARGWARVRDIGPEESSNSAIAIHISS